MFSQDFMDDVNEAYLYWLVNQKESEIPSMSLVQWSASILGRTVYTILAEKRVATAHPEGPYAQEKGRSSTTDPDG